MTIPNLSKEIENAATIGISGHIRPDGDCIGSTMGLYLYLRKVYPDKAVRIFLETPAAIFGCIKDLDRIEDASNVTDRFDVFFCVDCGKDRLGEAEKLFDSAARKINIDHHISNTGTGDVNYIVPTASSASELVFDLFDKDKLDEDIAKALYIGIIHDTGVLQYSNTAPKTLNTVAELIKFGFDFPALIEETFYEKTYLQTQIMGRALLESMLLMDGRVAVSQVDKKMMDFYRVDSKDFEGIVNQLRNIKGVEVAIFMYETAFQEYKVSLRSGGVINVSKIAQFFGGGGHVRAAGCNLTGSFHDVVNNITAHIEAQYKELNA
ncbi:MAG: bifunctional oligoribonuclease/PAP phosphatase NrnA [Lachnospiraceae bacterium]|nr:bifunctional oligoribonuclease/PAP phosphatase NrnA [Lachnospiraceae bacterium]